MTRYFIVDAFTSEPFRGNPAAVCLLAGPRPVSWMQAVAREFQLSETAFLHREKDHYRLRWFTPEVEVDLCGHATLASAQVLFSEGICNRQRPIAFETRGGPLTATWQGKQIALDFPSDPPRPFEAPESLLQALGMRPERVLRSERGKWLAELSNASKVRSLRVNQSALSQLSGDGLIVTAVSEGPFDFVSRYFCPQMGIAEDPVTGSAHCVLGPFWSERLGKSVLHAFQASSRGGEVGVRCEGNRVILLGDALIVASGNFFPQPAPF